MAGSNEERADREGGDRKGRDRKEAYRSILEQERRSETDTEDNSE